MIEKGKEAASDVLEASKADIDFAAGRFTVAGADRFIGIVELAAHQRARVAKGEDAILLDAAETGETSVLRYIVVDDVGKAVNPMIVRGQVHGGVAQGLGQALLELAAYDPSSGQLLSGSFMDHALPHAADLPNIEVEFVEVPCLSNPLGVKGAGEAGAVGSPPALINAVVDALAPLGVTHVDLPATAQSLWTAIRQAKAA